MARYKSVSESITPYAYAFPYGHVIINLIKKCSTSFESIDSLNSILKDVRFICINIYHFILYHCRRSVGILTLSITVIIIHLYYINWFRVFQKLSMWKICKDFTEILQLLSSWLSINHSQLLTFLSATVDYLETQKILMFLRIFIIVFLRIRRHLLYGSAMNIFMISRHSLKK